MDSKTGRSREQHTASLLGTEVSAPHPALCTAEAGSLRITFAELSCQLSSCWSLSEGSPGLRQREAFCLAAAAGSLGQ